MGNAQGRFTLVGNSTANVILNGNTVTHNFFDQIEGVTSGAGTLNFFSNGTLSNDVRMIPDVAGSLYRVEGGTPGGFIFINGLLHPADVTLP